jgi:hypothetical protein
MKRRPNPRPAPDHAIAAALCVVTHYEGKRSARIIKPEFAGRYRREDLISFGPALRDVIESVRRAFPKCAVSNPIVRRVLRKIETRKAGFRDYVLPDERPRGVFK